MTSSPESRIEPLPPALSSMWRLCRLGYQHEPGLMLVAFVLSLLSALPDALIAVWLKLLGDGVLGHQPRLVLAAAIGLAVSATATWFLRTVSTRVTRRFRDKVTIALESHIARLWRRSQRLRITSVRTTWIASRRSAIRCSCWITCTCRCSPPRDGYSALP